MRTDKIMAAREAIALGAYSDTSDAMGIAARAIIRRAVAETRTPPAAQCNFNRDFED